MADDPRNSWMRDWRAALAAVAVIAMLGTGYALLKPRTPPEPGPDTPRPEVLALLQRELPAEYRRYVDMAQRAQGKDPVAADLMLLEFLRGVEARNGRYLTLASDDTLYRVIALERDAAAVTLANPEADCTDLGPPPNTSGEDPAVTMIRAVAEGKRSPVRREPGTPLEYDTALDKVSPVERRAEVERFLQARRTAPDDRLSCEAHLAWLTALSELSPSLAAKLYADY